MKERIEKLDAAKRQLTTAIQLFFEERDKVSIHTLAYSALNILHDYIPDDEVWKHDIFLHYNTIYIKDEYRKICMNKNKEAYNFFKHADEDLKKGNLEIQFNYETTNFVIFEALKCLRII